MICIGLDVHKKNTVVVWSDTETGELSEPCSISTGQVVEGLVALQGANPDYAQTEGKELGRSGEIAW